MESLIGENSNTYPTIYVGDFNLHSIDWATVPGQGSVKPNAPRRALHESALKLFESNNLTQLITEQTHSKGNTLDLVLVDNNLLDDLKTEYEVLPPISDHNKILLTITHVKFTSQKIK